MTLFKKKKNKPPIFSIIDYKVKEARECGQTYFIYPLKQEDVEKVKEYFIQCYHGLVEADHKTDDIIFYKLYNIM